MMALKGCNRDFACLEKMCQMEQELSSGINHRNFVTLPTNYFEKTHRNELSTRLAIFVWSSKVLI